MGKPVDLTLYARSNFYNALISRTCVRPSFNCNDGVVLVNRYMCVNELFFQELVNSAE